MGNAPVDVDAIRSVIAGVLATRPPGAADVPERRGQFRARERQCLGQAGPVLAESASRPAAGFGAGALLAVLCAVLFAVGAGLQHEAAEGSTSASGLSWRRLMTKPKWVVGQLSTASGTGLQVAALALAPVAVVQPVLAVGLVVALAIRAVRHRTVPLKAELLGGALTTVGLAVFLVAARPAVGVQTHEPSTLGVLTAVVVSVVLVLGATLFGRGAHGAL